MVGGEEAVGVVKRLIDAFNRRDADVAFALLHDDVVCAGIPLPFAYGKQAAIELLKPFLVAEAVDWRLLGYAVNGRVVYTERIDRFRFAGADWTQVRAAGIFEVAADGRIVAWRDYFDLAELAAAMP